MATIVGTNSRGGIAKVGTNTSSQLSNRTGVTLSKPSSSSSGSSSSSSTTKAPIDYTYNSLTETPAQYLARTQPNNTILTPAIPAATGPSQALKDLSIANSPIASNTPITPESVAQAVANGTPQNAQGTTVAPVNDPQAPVDQSTTQVVPPGQQQQGFSGSQSGQVQQAGNLQTPSVVDYLASIGQPTDFNSRKAMANQLGISGYTGTAQQNSQLLSSLRGAPVTAQEQAAVPTSAGNVTQTSQAVSPTGGPAQSLATMGQTYGLTSTQNDFFNDPLGTISKITKQVYASTGIGDANNQIESISKDLEGLANSRDEELRAVDDNPWLTEGVRLRQREKINAKWSDKIDNRTNQLTLMENVRDSAQQQAQYALGTAISIYDNERRFQADQIQAYQNQAQREFDNAIKLATAGGNSKSDGALGRYQDAMAAGIISPETGYFDFIGAENAAGRAPSTGGAGNSNQVIDNERALFSQFRSEPIVKDYNTILSKKLSVDQIIQSGVGGPGDLAVVYEFMKGLDPTSVVRETEYASAARSGNIFAGALAKYNGYFKETGGFLPDSVKSGFQSIVNSKLKVQTQLYNNLSDEYRATAQRQGLNPDNVALGYNNANPASVQGPKSPSQTFDEVINTPGQPAGGFFSNFLTGLFGN